MTGIVGLLAATSTVPEEPASPAPGPALTAALAAIEHRGRTRGDHAHDGAGDGTQTRTSGALALGSAGGDVAESDGRLAAADGLDGAEVLLAYAANGPSALAKLAGRYAVVVADPAESGRLVLAADAGGRAPLYYARLGQGWVVGSEPGALLAAGVPAAPDEAVVRHFLLRGACDDGAATFFAGISRVRPGEVVVCAGDTATVEVAAAAAQSDDMLAGLAALGEGQRVGVRLGGAAGASLIGSVSRSGAAAGADGRVDVWAERVPPTDGGDDPALAALLSGLNNLIVSHRIDAGADGLAADLSDVVRAAGEPLPRPDLWQIWTTARTAAENVTVLMDPSGAPAEADPGAGRRRRRTLDPASLLKPGPGDDGVSAAGSEGSADPVGERAAARRLADRAGARHGVTVLVPYAVPGGAAPDTTTLTPLAAKAAARLRPLPVRQWMLRLKNRIYGEFLSESFVNRPWVDQQAVLTAFEDFIKGRTTDPLPFWRHLSVELWLREWVDEKPAEQAAPRVKGPLEPNADKSLQIAVDDESWLRFPIRTELFSSGDPLEEKIGEYVADLVTALQGDKRYAANLADPWYLLVSEKIVAIAQGRSYFIWDIQPSWWARTLSRFVVRTPWGIGLGSPWTMQLAIQEVGLPRILVASAASAAGKAVGKRGVFYRVAGPGARAIDGPTEYSVYPANVSAKLAPAEPEKVSARLTSALRERLPAEVAGTLGGCVVIDANDIGRNVLGQDTDRPDQFFEELFADNPLGQGSEQTPLAVAVRGS
jgi:asparagine synthase (glutamine-hydrolysing)